GGLAATLDRAEHAQQRASPARPDAREVIELRADRGLPAEVAVVRDREAMGLVAKALDEVQGLRRRRQEDRLGDSRKDQLLALLRESGERQVVEAELVEDLLRGVHLGAAAVDDHEVRHLPAALLGRALVATGGQLEPAPEHLLVRGDVVRALDPADPEAA